MFITNLFFFYFHRLFTSTNFEDTKGFIDEPLNLKDVAKGHSVDTPTSS